ncbi:TetR/AcrR family transcriptional regulator [Embleya hyalina]|uniref:Transcriptional regulator n=1 Tax=Embleya hyalina TaxID=516124 RepID=A0A401YQE1_9ACTN|nr:TetR/AcrR family transcriptional regulator C-terminal domain-containing protein [Embleya hyalina]GCD96811.1 transcriptional regulator [Embleya hyalina]
MAESAAESPTSGTASIGRRSAAKRDAILRAAFAVFLREGYAGASVDAVAAAAGVGKQTVYAHFGDKERLFIAATRESPGPTTGDGAGDGPDPITATGDPHADLSAAGVRILRSVLDPDAAALHRLTIAEIARHPELQLIWRKNAPREVLAALAAYFAERDAAGDLDVPEPERSARQFVILLASEGRVASLHGVQPLSDDEVHRIADETADLIVRAHRRADGGR